MTELYLIQGGRDLSDADRAAALAAIPFLPLMDSMAAAQFAARAEKEAETAAALVTPAVAILAKDKAELVSMLAARPGDVAEAQEAFKAAIAAALVQLAVLRAAESRLSIAATAAAQSTDPLPVYIL